MLNQQKEEISELRDMMQTTKSEVSEGFSEASDLLDSSVSDAKASLDKDKK